MEVVKTALCSFGMSGWVFHAPFIDAHKGFALHAVYERSKNLAKERYPFVRTYRSLEEMLADKAVDLVVVNTPNATHFDFARKTLQAGKHVLVEKPFTIETEEAEELIALAKKMNRVLSVYHNRRWDSDYLTVKNIVSEQTLGAIVEAEIHFDRYKQELSPKLHKETPGPGTGALYDLGSHLVDQAIQLFGMPDAVFADIAVMRSVSQVDDYFELLLYYDASRVRLRGTYVAREPVPSYILHGTRGSFLKSRADIQETALQSLQIPGSAGWGKEPVSEQGLLHTEHDGAVTRERVTSATGNYMQFYDQLHAAITQGKSPPVSGEDGWKVIKVIKAAFKSNDEKRVIELSR